MFNGFGFGFGYGPGDNGQSSQYGYSNRSNQSRSHGQSNRQNTQSNNFYRQSTGFHGNNSENTQNSNNQLISQDKPRICHYVVLGIEKNANEKEIKKAYHKQSLIWHPDKNSHRLEEAEERFKLISEAYQILNDEQKKQIYDLYGFEGPPAERDSGFEQGSFSSDLFPFSHSQSSSFFTSRGPSFGFGDPADFFSPFGAPFSSPFGGQTTPFGFGTRQSNLNNFFSPFGQDDSFGAFPAFPSFSMFPDFPGMSSSFSSGGSFQGGSSSGSSVRTSTTYENGRATTYKQTIDANGNVTTEVHYH